MIMLCLGYQQEYYLNILCRAKPINSCRDFFWSLGVAAIARPIGAFIFGYIGDKYGRIKALKIAAVLAALSTCAVGLIPDFALIGSYAPAMLLVCRMVFIISLAGEVDGCKIYIVEKMGASCKNLAVGLTSFHSQSGAFLAAYLYALSLRIDPESYMWRINFLIGGVSGFAVIAMRRYLEESDSFLEVLASRKSSDEYVRRGDLLSLISQYKKQFLSAILINGILGCLYHFFIIFLNIFMSRVLAIDSLEEAGKRNLYLILIYGVASIVAGFCADRFNSLRQARSSIVLSILILLFWFGFSNSKAAMLPHLSFVCTFLLPFLDRIKLESLILAQNERWRYA
jgi:MHS family proline/betaine transporter-like MFS transporter